ncbi:MAG: M20/M25/M40 family metallo-hydrolase [Planctomycetales bacterium]|nr:M20/M25/M40 family metallo-hydrolase [Planctomycetales bacterium]
MEMMAIPGASGDEKAAAEFVRQYLLAAGADAKAIGFDSAHKRTPIAGQTGNLIFKLPGTIKAPRRLLMAHLDTVPICVGSKPVRKGKFVVSADPATGLGADDRAGAAVVLLAALNILKRKLPHPPLTFLWTVQEEIGLHGARHVSVGRLGKPQLAFNFDGGSPTKLTIGATGGYRMEIVVHGVASHAGGAPERGVSAIAVAALAIADLHQRGWHGDINKDGAHGTSNVGVIAGGAATNVVTDRVVVRAEARSHDPKFRRRIVREIEQAFARAARQVRNVDGQCGHVVIDGRLDYDSFLLKASEPCVTVAQQALRDLGEQPQLAITNGGLDANWMARHGIPTVTLGAGQLNQHMVSEKLDIAQFHTACQVALRLAAAID